MIKANWVRLPTLIPNVNLHVICQDGRTGGNRGGGGRGGQVDEEEQRQIQYAHSRLYTGSI